MSENQDPLLRRLVETSLSRRERLFRIGGWACIVSCALFTVMVLSIPVQPGEENIQLGFFAFAVFLLGMGVMVIRSASRQSLRIRELIYEKPHEMASIKVLIIQSKNGLRIPTVRIVDKRGRQYGLIMRDEDTAREVVQRTLA